MKELSHLLELPAIDEAIPVSDDVREELDRRLAAYYADPSSARPWDEIKDDLLRRK